MAAVSVLREEVGRRSVLIREEANLRFQHLRLQTDSEAANRRARVHPPALLSFALVVFWPWGHMVDALRPLPPPNPPNTPPPHPPSSS